MMSVFSALHPELQSLLSSMNMKTPTEPQVKALPLIQQGNHVVLIAPTGLGKTESALLPVFDQFLRARDQGILPQDKEKGIFIIYITPLRALNRDMLRRTLEWGKKLGISIAVRHGDTTAQERTRQAQHPPDMLITTPETFQILFMGKRLRRHVGNVYWVIVDEIHELAGDERGAQLAVALERLVEVTKEKGHEFQRIGLSATVGTAEEAARFLGGQEKNIFRDVSVVQVDVTKHITLQVELPRILPGDYPEANRLSLEPMSFAAIRECIDLIKDHQSTLLFINTRDGAEILASRFHLWKQDFPIGVHHGSLAKSARVKAEDEFKSGVLQSLICTSSLELGIDVGSTDFVIQYNSPREVQRILQRVGRSGHKRGKTSKGLILTTNSEDLAESVVIARRALRGELEALSVRQNPLTVLANQIISIALEYGKITREKIYAIIQRAYPFHRLSADLFHQVLEQLRQQRSLWFEEEYVVKRRSSREYFLDNISMIPDEKTYMAVDISSRKNIGKLDESFVVSYAVEGSRFILNGRPWIVVKREEDTLLIAPSKEMGNAPSWSGEDIPVPFAVAEEVGRLRRMLATGNSAKEYPLASQSMECLQKLVKEQLDHGFIVPDDRTVTLEGEKRTIVINACWGTKVNETLGRLISAMLAQTMGESVGITSDPYRIILELPVSIPPQRVQKILESITPESVEYLLRTVLRNSPYMRWQLVHVARKFGAIRKDFDYKNVGQKKLLALFEQTLVAEEAVEKLMWEKMDVLHTKEVLHRVQAGEIILQIQGLAPLSQTGLDTIRGLMVPLRPDRTILRALKLRLLETELNLVCTNCHHSWSSTVGRVEEHPRCSSCGAIKIAVVHRSRHDVKKYLKKKQPTADELREIRRLHKNASLVLRYGKPAIMALAGRGIGPDTAVRILRRYSPLDLRKSEEVENRFLADILKAELTYARTRGFWDT
jgi:ATP-dependent Lhr-like helicase